MPPSDDRAVIPGPRPVGRPSVLDSLGLTIESIVETYKAQKSIPKTAALLGISVNTCKKYLKIAKATGPQGGRAQPYPWKARQVTPVHAWFREHRNDRLPRSSEKLSEMSGFRVSQIKKYLYTRKAAAEAHLRSLGDLRARVGYAIDVLGRRIPLGMIADYVIKVDTYDLTVRIEAMLRMGGTVNFLLTFRQYQEVFHGEEEAR